MGLLAPRPYVHLRPRNIILPPLSYASRFACGNSLAILAALLGVVLVARLVQHGKRAGPIMTEEWTHPPPGNGVPQGLPVSAMSPSAMADDNGGKSRVSVSAPGFVERVEWGNGVGTEPQDDEQDARIKRARPSIADKPASIGDKPASMDWLQARMDPATPSMPEKPASIGGQQARTAPARPSIAGTPASIADEPASIAGQQARREHARPSIADKPTSLADKSTLIDEQQARMEPAGPSIADKPRSIADKPASIADKPASIADTLALIAGKLAPPRARHAASLYSQPDDPLDTEDQEKAESVHRKLAPPARAPPSSQYLEADEPLVTQGDDEETCWIFMHMEKSGGGLARSIATERWRRDELIFDTVQWRRGDDFAEDVMTRFHWRLLHGGCVEALRKREGRMCKWFTVFRHPVARLISAFDHCLEAPKDPICVSTQTSSLAEFAEQWGNFALRQFAMSAVSTNAVKEWAATSRKRGGGSAFFLLKEYLSRGGVGGDAAIEHMLEPVQELLSSQYAAVGIAEDMDTTMRLFDKALSMSELNWSSSLELRVAAGIGELCDDVGKTALKEALADDRIVSALNLDILLYEHAVQVFREQVVRFGVE